MLLLSVTAFSKQEKSERQKSRFIKVINGLTFDLLGLPLLRKNNRYSRSSTNTAIYYVATAAGGVWKTGNGTSFEPLFDVGSYSIGCITIDPNNPNVVGEGGTIIRGL